MSYDVTKLTQFFGTNKMCFMYCWLSAWSVNLSLAEASDMDLNVFTVFLCALLNECCSFYSSTIDVRIESPPCAESRYFKLVCGRLRPFYL